MLFGEHAVLYGRAAVVGAVHCRLWVRARIRTDGRLVIRSGIGQFNAPIRDTSAPPPALRFAVLAARQFAARFPVGLELDITSDFPPTIGLGSSAAVTVAVSQAAAELSGQPLPPDQLLETARTIVRAAQDQVGSGADVAASVWGGVLLYHAADARPILLPGTVPLTVVYSGYKTPTPEVIRRVAARHEADPAGTERLFDESDRLAKAAAEAIRSGALPELGALMNAAQEVMEALGVSDAMLADIVATLRATPGIYGAKISGAGLGDCVIGLGHIERYTGPGRRIPVVLSVDGVRKEK